MISLIKSLIKALEPPLPGDAAHAFMEPSVRFTGTEPPDPLNARQSSVLILLYPSGDGFGIPFIQRADYPGVHGGQISLPGGKCEPGDQSFWDTALRETREELGVDTDEVAFLGQLSPLFIPNSNFVVYPQVGYLDQVPDFIPNSTEVAEVFQVPLGTFFDFANIKRFTRQVNGNTIHAPYYDVDGRQIWGATAMIISEFVVALRLKAPDLISALHFCNDHTFQESP